MPLIIPVLFASPPFPLHHRCHGALSDLPARPASTHRPKPAPFGSRRSLPLVSWACLGISSLVTTIGWMCISLTSRRPTNDCPLVHILQSLNTSELATSTRTPSLKTFFFFCLATDRYPSSLPGRVFRPVRPEKPFIPTRKYPYPGAGYGFWTGQGMGSLE